MSFVEGQQHILRRLVGIDNIEQIDRGYENIEARLNALGAKIKRV